MSLNKSPNLNNDGYYLFLSELHKCYFLGQICNFKINLMSNSKNSVYQSISQRFYMFMS